MPQQQYSKNLDMDDDYPYSPAIEDEGLDSERKSSGTTPNHNSFNPNFYNPFEIKHRRRTSRGQFKILEKAFIENPKPNGKIRQGLAESLSMSPRGVQVWFQNRRAKAKQQQKQKQKQNQKQIKPTQECIVQDLEVSINCQYEPVILSASNMVHSRSQSSTSSSAYTCSDSLPLSYSSSSCFTMEENKIQHVNRLPWYNDASTVEEDDSRMITSSSSPPVQSQAHVNSSDQNLWMDSLVDHQTLFNEQQQSAVIGNHNNATIMPKPDPFNSINDTWTYSIGANDQLVPITQAVLQNVIGHPTTRLLGNNRNVDEWVSTQHHPVLFNQIMNDDNAMRRRSYPLEQDEAYWAGHQVRQEYTMN
jgi:hypothetical protein